MQIAFILKASGYVVLQKKGFQCMLHYMGTTHPVVLHPYVPPFIAVVDTEGHDRLCGHYTARIAAVKQLCLVCECPTIEMGYSMGKHPYRLVRDGSLGRLQSLSQNYLQNVLDAICFGKHNNRGIFGACPGEMLRLISLGWFKYCLEAFAEQTGGPKAVALKLYDEICAQLGDKLMRQSDCNVPRMNVPKGFSSGTNLMGHEFTGCLLVRLFALLTIASQMIFPMRKKNSPNKHNLDNPEHVKDWVLVVSSLLQWYQWIKEPHLTKLHVLRLHATVQWLMRLVADIAPQTTGMGNNTIKRHLVLNLCQDMLDHGVPQNMNSAYAESANISLAKETSMRTQKCATSFTFQAATRYTDNLALDLACDDLRQDTQRLQPIVPTELESGLTGWGFFISVASGKNASPTFTWNRRTRADNPKKDCLPVTRWGLVLCSSKYLQW